MNLTFSTKDPDEKIVVSIDFSNVLEAGETITACEFSAIDMTDPKNPVPDDTMCADAADISDAPIVKQKITGGTAKHNYMMKATVTTAARTLVGSAMMSVRLGGA